MGDCLPRFRKFAVNVMGIPAEDPDAPLKGVEAMEDFFRSIGMPTSLKELGISPSEEDMETLARKCAAAAGGKKGSAKVLYEADMLKIYRMANQR